MTLTCKPTCLRLLAYFSDAKSTAASRCRESPNIESVNFFVG